MKKEDKDLLLKDLCARLPYGVKVHINSPIEEQNSMELFDVNLDGEHIGVGNEKWAFRAIPIIDDEDEAKVVKPYLRPMSSMTEEEENEWCGLNIDPLLEAVGKRHTRIEDLMLRTKSQYQPIEWLSAHHFDYRGLIEKGLALEALEGMYNHYKE